MTTFDAPRAGTGTHEWADRTLNIARGCQNNCLYCYAAENAHRFKLRKRDEWDREELTKRAHITSYPANKGVVMFPSSHDITPSNLDEYVRVAKLLLKAGNRLLCVSKPRLLCIERITGELAEYSDAILFRFTIGTTDPAIAAHWEPGAPCPAERISSLKLAFDAGYRTSVSAEPLLGGFETAQAVLEAVRPYVTDSVWIGKMNKTRARVDLTMPGNLERVVEIEQAQTDPEIRRLVEGLRDDPLVRWKDSVQQAMTRMAC